MRIVDEWPGDAIVEAWSPRSLCWRRWRVRWGPHPVRCCRTLFRVEADNPPVLDFDPNSDGGIVARMAQCGQCGQYVSAQVRIEAAASRWRPVEGERVIRKEVRRQRCHK